MVSELWTAILFIITLVSLSWITWFLLTQTKHRKALPPGPLGLPIIGNLLSLDPELHINLAKLAQAHGPIFSLRLGTNKLAIVISSPSLAKQVLKDNDVTFANRDVPVAVKAATYGGSDMAWASYGPQLRFLRKVCVRDMLGPASLEAVYDVRRREVRRTIRLITGRAQARKAVNIGEEMFVTGLNVVTGMLWGGTIKEGEERENLGREFREAVKELMGLLGLPNVSDFFPGLARFDLQGIEKKVKVCAKKFDVIFERVIDLRLRMMKMEGKEREKDFLEVLLQLVDQFKEGNNNNNNTEVEYTRTHLKALFMDMVIAGTDTISNTVEFAMAEIMNKSEVLKKVQQELNTAIGDDNIVEEHDIHKLPYLQAVIKETMRLHPVVPLLIPHCPSAACIVGGYNIPRGSRVIMNVWVIHRDPSKWPNPLEFDPERFLNAKFDFYGNDFSYLPFGSGRRICVGIAMAEKMMLFSLASILHSFDWKLPVGEKLDLQEKFGSVLSKRIPLVMIPKTRLHNPALYE